MTVFLELDQSHAAMRPALIEAMAASSLPVVSNRQQALLIMSVTVRETIRNINGTIRADGSADLILSERTAGRQLAATSLSEVGDGTHPDIAKERLLDKLAAELAEHVDKHIVDWMAR